MTSGAKPGWSGCWTSESSFCVKLSWKPGSIIIALARDVFGLESKAASCLQCRLHNSNCHIQSVPMDVKRHLSFTPKFLGSLSVRDAQPGLCCCSHSVGAVDCSPGAHSSFQSGLTNQPASIASWVLALKRRGAADP